MLLRCLFWYWGGSSSVLGGEHCEPQGQCLIPSSSWLHVVSLDNTPKAHSSSDMCCLAPVQKQCPQGDE